MGKTNRRSKHVDAADVESPAVADGGHEDFGNRVRELEQHNKALQSEVEELRCKLAKGFTSPDSGQKLKEMNLQKLNLLEEQVTALKKKVGAQSQLSTHRKRSDEATKRLQDEIQRLKAQKVQLQCQNKLQSVEFRLCKASMEKEFLQLKKEGRRNKYEIHKLSALNQRQKMVMQRKTEEAYLATKRLKELIESRKAFSRRASGSKNRTDPQIQSIERELEVTEQVREVCSEYERQIEEMAEEVAKFKEEAEMLKQENFRFLSQDKDVDCSVKESELRDLKEEILRLGSLVRQVEIQKARQVPVEKSKVDPKQQTVRLQNHIDIFEDMNTPESENSEATVGSTVAMEQTTSSKVCCSCSKKSLCKTNKCGCLASGGSCGASCGCAPSKCTNRVAMAIKLDESPQSGMAVSSVNSSSTVETVNSITLASEGAKLLQNALNQKPVQRKGNSGPRKKPLCDIGNILSAANVPKPAPKKKGRKPAIQLVTAPSPSLPENTDCSNDTEKHPIQADRPVKLTRRTVHSAASD